MMEEQNNTSQNPKTLTTKIIRQNAISLSAIFIIVLIGTYLLREQTKDIAQYFWIAYTILLLFGILYTQVHIREKVNDGLISFGDAFMAGFKMSLWVALIFAVFNFIFYQFIFPEAKDEMLQLTEQSMREKGMSEEEIEMGMKFTGFFVSPAGILISTMVMYPIMGAIASLIAAAFTQRAKR
jgi:hypothetical protein